MERNEILKDIRERFKEDILDFTEKSAKRVYIGIKPESLVKIAVHVFKGMGARFNIASGLDGRDFLEILYHFTFDEANVVISFRVKLKKDKPEIDSLAPHIEATNWIERELSEILGVKFNGHPDMRPLLLPDNWPKGVYPLRRDYKEWDPNAIRDRGV